MVVVVTGLFQFPVLALTVTVCNRVCRSPHNRSAAVLLPEPRSGPALLSSELARARGLRCSDESEHHRCGHQLRPEDRTCTQPLLRAAQAQGVRPVLHAAADDVGAAPGHVRLPAEHPTTERDTVPGEPGL